MPGRARRNAWRHARGAGRRTAALAGAALLVPGLLAGQQPDPPEIGLAAGAFSYDLGIRGDAASAFGGLRARFPLSRWVLVEPALSFTRLTADSVVAGADPEATLVVLEFQLHVQYPLEGLRPYLGAGAGGMFDLRGERGPDEFVVSTFSGAAGLAVDLTRRWILRGELRRRAMDDAHSAVELGVVLSRAF